jgi:hypothetical protein
MKLNIGGPVVGSENEILSNEADPSAVLFIKKQ